MALEHELQIKQALGRIARRQELVQRYRDYYAGKHRLSFASQKFREAFGNLFREFADNLCPVVVTVPADKMELQGFTVPENDALAADLEKLAKSVKLDILQGQVHIEALKCGVAYVLAWKYADKPPKLYLQRAHIMELVRDEEDPDEVLVAVKCWRPDGEKKARLNLYYKDRVERYVGGETISAEKLDNLQPFTGDGSPAVQPHSWGVVPVVAFVNGDDAGGRSELHDAIPIQDGVNKFVLDMIVAGESHSIPQRWIAGLEKETDENGRNITPIPKGGGLWSFEDTETKVGQLEAANFTQMLAGINDFRKELSRVSGIPGFYFDLSGDIPSGESLKMLESRLTEKVRRRQTLFGDSWENIFRILLQMRGEKDVPDIEAVWRDATPRSESDQITNAATKVRDLGVSQAQAQRELGYKPKEIETMAEERKEESESRAAIAMRAFDRGTQTEE